MKPISKKLILSATVTGGLFLAGGAAYAAEKTPTDTTTPTTEVKLSEDTVLNSDSNSTETPKENGGEVDLRILATTDLHTNLVNYDYYQDKPSEKIGLAKTAVLIDEAKKENSNVLLVDNGDIIQGTPLGTYKAIVDPVKKGENHPMYEALEKLNYDAGTLGNHEFNYGLDFLNTVISGTKIPIVNANVIDDKTGTYKFNPYKILEKTFKDNNNQDVTLKIGITGIVPPQIMTWDKANLEGKVHVEDSVEALKKIVPVIKAAGADLVVVLSHSGIGDDKYEVGEENEGYQIATMIPDVDAVVTGHSHAEFPSRDGKGIYEKIQGVDGEKGQILGKPVVMAGKYGDNLGIIDLKLKKEAGKWKVADSKGFLRRVDDKSNVADQGVIDVAKKAHEGTIEYVRKQVGETTADITSYFSLVKDDPSIQIVNNAQLWYAKKELKGTDLENLPLLSAAAPFKAGTRNDATAYTDIPKGGIAIKNVADLYLYDNVTAVLKVTGAQLKEWLEMSAGQFNQVDPNKKEAQDFVNTVYRTYNFDVIDGVTYEIDITQPAKYDKDGKTVNKDANRIKKLQYQGKDVKDDQDFVVVTNNYRAFGPFPGVKDASVKKLLNLENRQAIINYITEVKTINPTADNNWTFADTIKGLDLQFVSAMKAKDLINSKDIVFSKEGENGFGIYKFVYQDKVSTEIPTDYPTVDELPEETITTEIPTDYPTVELPEGIVTEVPTEYPTVELPKYDIEKLNKEITEKVDKKNTTGKKTLPNTGVSASSTALGLGALALGMMLAFRKRRR